MCVGGNLPTLGLLYGLVTATFLHSAASEQHIPQREGGRKKKRVSIERGRTGNEESVKKGGGGSVYMFESRRRICGEGGVKRVEMHWQRKLVKEGKRVIKISCVTDPPPPLSCEILTPIFSAWRSEVRVRCSATRASAEKREKATSSFLKYSSSYSHERSHAHARTHTEYSRPQCSLMCVYLLSLLDLFLMNYAGRKQNNPATQLHPSAQTHKEIIIYVP